MLAQTYYLVACFRHGEECFSVGSFRSREEAQHEIAAVQQFGCPTCGGPLTIDTIPRSPTQDLKNEP